ILVLELTLSNLIEEDLDIEICSGESFEFGGQLLSTSGTFRQTFTTDIGCDSTVNLNLTVLDPIEENIAEQICFGQAFEFGGEQLTAAGTYRDTLNTDSGCDSIVVLELTLSNLIEEDLDIEICSGESFEFGGQLLNTSGTFRQTFTTDIGCDSTVNLNLTVLETIEMSASTSICAGESIQFGNQSLTLSGIYSDTLSATNGCDSIITLNLTVRAAIQTSLNESICPNATFQFGEQTLDAVGVYRDTLTATDGCDSIVTLNLDVIDFSVSIDADASAIGCEFTELTLNAIVNPSPTRIEWFSNEQVVGTSEELLITSGGTYQVVVENEAGCRAENTITISEDLAGVGAALLNVQQPNCEGNDLGSVLISEVTGGLPPYVYALDDGVFSTSSSFRNLAAGDYTIRIQDAQGCEWDSTITITPASDLFVDLGEDIIISFGADATLAAIVNGNFSGSLTWSSDDKDSLLCLDALCLSRLVQPLVTTTYNLQIEDENGCIATDQITVFVERKQDVYAPNVFSPDGNNINDFFYLQTANTAVENIEYLRIFDRWGHLVFQRNNFPPNDASLGWDGRSQNREPMNPAVFVFVAKVNYTDGSNQVLEGEVVLVR
ncbi:MAG: gliding motility-associated C-terminal domain-containing protein, partial [Bacteroidota bacterium]